MYISCFAHILFNMLHVVGGSSRCLSHCFQSFGPGGGGEGAHSAHKSRSSRVQGSVSGNTVRVSPNPHSTRESSGGACHSYKYHLYS